MIVRKIVFVIIIAAFFGCQSEYQKMLKSTDYDAQYTAAVKLYDEGDYYKAYSLFEKVLPAFRLTERAEKVNYYIARCYYEEADYLMAAYYFERYLMTFPTGEMIEQSYYYSAICYFYNSPKSSLDQEYTNKAISAFQIYLNKYPQGSYIKESNDYIAQLRTKLELKAFETSKLYVSLEDYKAAIVVLKNCLKQYPDTKYREEILYLTLESSFLLAQKSVESKKQERYDATISEYHTYIDEFPNGKWAKDAEKIYLQAKKKNN